MIKFILSRNCYYLLLSNFSDDFIIRHKKISNYVIKLLSNVKRRIDHYWIGSRINVKYIDNEKYGCHQMYNSCIRKIGSSKFLFLFSESNDDNAERTKRNTGIFERLEIPSSSLCCIDGYAQVNHR